MVELRPKSPCDGLLPLKIGKATMTEICFDAITSVAPFKDMEAQVSEALGAQTGAAFPDPNRTTGTAKARAVWCGYGQCMVLGPPLAPIAGAAMTDQTDAWACTVLEGPAARDVLARLAPIDLRAHVFAEGHAARTLVGHMSAILMRTEENRYGIMVFRSMAWTLVHEVKSAMETVATRS